MNRELHTPDHVDHVEAPSLRRPLAVVLGVAFVAAAVVGLASSSAGAEATSSPDTVVANWHW